MPHSDAQTDDPITAFDTETVMKYSAFLVSNENQRHQVIMESRQQR